MAREQTLKKLLLHFQRSETENSPSRASSAVFIIAVAENSEIYSPQVLRVQEKLHYTKIFFPKLLYFYIRQFCIIFKQDI